MCVITSYDYAKWEYANETRLSIFVLKFFDFLSIARNFVTGNACECGMQVVMQKKGWYADPGHVLSSQTTLIMNW